MFRSYKSHLYLLAVASLFAGCAAPSSPTNGQNDQDRPDAIFHIDSRPGYYQHYFSELSGAENPNLDPLRVVFAFRRLQPSDIYAPTLYVCVEAKEIRNQFCLMAVKNRAYDDLGFDVKFMPRFGAEQKIEHLPRLSGPLKTHVVDMTFDGMTVTLRLDGKVVRVQEMTVKPDTVFLNCSSALCEFKFYNPPDGYGETE